MRASVSIESISDSLPCSFARGSSNLCPARYPSTVTNDADGATPGINGILIPTHIDNTPIKYDGNPASIPAVLHELELWTLRTGHFKDLTLIESGSLV